MLIAGLAAIAASIVLLVLVLTWRSAPSGGVGESLEAIEKVYSGPRSAAAADGSRLGAWARSRSGALAARLTPGNAMESLRRRLDAAGGPSGWTPERVLSVKGYGLIAGTLALGGLVGGPALPFWAVCGGAAGFYLPDVLLYNAALRRREEIVRALPDVIDLLVVSVEAGLGFEAAFGRVAASVDGPIGAELARVMREMQLGRSREEALRDLAARAGVEGLSTFVSALVQAAELGIPIGAVLREQAREIRLRRRQAAEERAQKLPVKITFPVALFIMPALLIVVIGPGLVGYLAR